MRHHAFGISLSAAVFLALVPSADGATLYVANNGLDGPGCGSKASPCRSISRAVNVEASDGDSIVVRPGRYGDLNQNGTLADSPGEESGGFGCMILLARAVTLTSSDGAASTYVDASSVGTTCNVGIAVDGTKFGKPGKGFLVTNSAANVSSGILINATNVTVAGNQVFGLGGTSVYGIDTVDAPQSVLIEGNQVMGWAGGIRARGDGKTVRKNQVSRNCFFGIDLSGTSVAVGNVTIGNGRVFGGGGGCVAFPGVGISLNGASTAVGNGSYGNGSGFTTGATFSGTLRTNNIFGNVPYGLYNAGVPGVIATDNYWGAPTGPGLDPADDVFNAGAGTTTVTPFATKPVKVKAPIKP